MNILKKFLLWVLQLDERFIMLNTSMRQELDENISILQRRLYRIETASQTYVLFTGKIMFGEAYIPYAWHQRPESKNDPYPQIISPVMNPMQIESIELCGPVHEITSVHIGNLQVTPYNFNQPSGKPFLIPLDFQKVDVGSQIRITLNRLPPL